MIKLRQIYPLVITSLIFLSNPNINIIDVLPDCIAYLLLILVIGSLGETVPYLAECRSALVKLALVTLVKLPAVTVMYSNMTSGKDIVPLFTLVFAALEVILLYSAVENGYKALSYLGERTDCSSVRDPFRISRKTVTTPEALRIFTLAFFFLKSILSVIPELFLLTPESISLRRKLADAYPTVIVLCIFASLIIGIIWLCRTIKYVKTINKADDMRVAIDSLKKRGAPEEESAKDTLKRLTSSLTLIAVSSLFIFDVVISDFGGYNILPHFIYGIILFCALFNYAEQKTQRILYIISTSGFCVSSLLSHFALKRFFDTFTYMHLSYSKSAMEAYNAVKIYSVIEFIFAIAMLFAAAWITRSLITSHTDVAPDDVSYSKINERNHQVTFKKTLPLFIIAAVINAMKLVNVFIKQTTKIIYSEVNPDGIASSGVPVMDTLIFLACAVYVTCAFVTSSNIKDEVKFKYGKE